jgi:Asp-tRNA(Asn)/Glu-tRNA(Gln) amidotransferase A subunit family amidase
MRADFEKLRAIPLDNGIPPALRFDPAPAAFEEAERLAGGPPLELPRIERPSSDEDLAFASVAELASLLRSRALSPVELARIYLDRLERFDPKLHAVITLTAERAVRQAERAEREIARGGWRGPLHGIPWGAKDLLAVPGYPTTWGAGPFRDQVRPEKATVVARLEEAGAVLLAKTAVGELAWGDVWYGGTTKNPWKLEEGSSGSSAGSAAATAAGLLAFALGTETWGSIVSPCTRCGVSGLRPTFGRVSRHGAMALAWSMDKIGPIARTVEDCALVFSAIHGADGLDAAAVDRPFHWPPRRRDPRSLRVGVVEALFEEDYGKWTDNEEDKPRFREWQANDRATLEVLRELGFELRPVRLPDRYPVGALSHILSAEAATAFDELTRSGADRKLVRQVADAWPTVFRLGHLVPAVEYLRANRIRTLLLREMGELFERVDVYVCPTYGGDNLLLTNLTGHPAVVVPNGFRASDGTPTSITFIGKLYGEEELLSVAWGYQRATNFHTRRPPIGG